MPRLRAGSKYCTVGVITDQASIDRYAALLAPGYKKASWKWWPPNKEISVNYTLGRPTRTAIPSAYRISEVIAGMVLDNYRESGSISSGGIRVMTELIGGDEMKMTLQVDWSIAAHIPVLNNNSGEDA